MKPPPEKADSWYASPFYSNIGIAQAWGVRPSELGLCEPGDDPAVMMAYSRTKARIEAIDRHEAERDRERERAKAKNSRSMRHRR